MRRFLTGAAWPLGVLALVVAEVLQRQEVMEVQLTEEKVVMVVQDSLLI